MRTILWKRLGWAAAACALAGCTTNPTTGRRIFNMGRDREVALGAQQSPQMVQQFGGEVADAALRGYINEVGQKIKDQTGVDDSKAHEEIPGPKREWKFTLLDSDVVNAFALPGERVFITRGLADKLTSEAQLAGVLGHECGHVMAQHSSERVGQAMGVQILTQAAGVIAGAATKNTAVRQGVPMIVGQGGALTALSFSRDQESEADALGMRYMTRAGYNPRGQLEVMQVLRREAGGGGIEMLQTHPLPATRIERVGNDLRTTYAYTQSGARAASFGDFPDRYRQRYLSVWESKPKTPAKGKKKAEVPVDGNGRTRLLAGVVAVDADDPSAWCAVCRANAGMTGR